jgi:hypothetical protein
MPACLPTILFLFATFGSQALELHETHSVRDQLCGLVHKHLPQLCLPAIP